jgi:hypothetical protein
VIETAPSTAWYVYAVVGSQGDELRDALGGARGVGSDELSLVEADGLTAVVGTVPLAEFGEAALHEHLNDRAWLEEKARAHEEVLQRVAAATTAIVPLRFGSIHRDLRDVETLLDERRGPFERALAHVRGRVEVGVKGWFDPRRDDAAATAPTGRAYLERRREERSRGESETAELEDALHEIHATLLALAVDGVLNRPQPRELTGRPERMVLNAAYLVPAGDEALAGAVAELAARHRGRGLLLEVTGPWPPHNFVDLGGEQQP